MTAPSTPGESRQRVATIIQQLRDFGEMGPEGGHCDTLIEVFSSMAREAADALAKAEARLVEVERELDYFRGSYVQTHYLCGEHQRETMKQFARADAAEARIATVRAEGFVAGRDAAARLAAVEENEQRNAGAWSEGMTDMARQLFHQIRNLTPAGTSSCAAKDGEAKYE